MVRNALSTCNPTGKEPRAFSFNKVKPAGGIALGGSRRLHSEAGGGAQCMHSPAICRSTFTHKPVSPKMN